MIGRDCRWRQAAASILEADERTMARRSLNSLARNDAERQALLEAHGETVLRGSWDQATLQPREVHEMLVDADAPHR